MPDLFVSVLVPNLKGAERAIDSGAHLMTVHNLHYYQELMQGLRAAIAVGVLNDFVAEFYRRRV